MDISFTQTLQSLGLPSHQKQMAISHFETVGLEKTFQNLQLVAVKFFGAYRPTANKNATFHVDTESTLDLGTEESEHALRNKAVVKKSSPWI